MKAIQQRKHIRSVLSTTLSVALLFSMPFCSSACADNATRTSLKALPENEYNSSFIDHGHPIEETEDVFFILCDQLLHYYDKKTGNCVIYSDDDRSGREILDLQFHNGQHEALFTGAHSLYLRDGQLLLLSEKDSLKSEYDLLEFDPVSKKRRIITTVHATMGEFVLKADKVYTSYRIVEHATVQGDYCARYFVEIYDLEQQNTKTIEITDFPPDFYTHNLSLPELSYNRENFIVKMCYTDTESIEMDGKTRERDIMRELAYCLNFTTNEHSYDWYVDSSRPELNCQVWNTFEWKGENYYSCCEFPEFFDDMPLEDIAAKFQNLDTWYSKNNELTSKAVLGNRIPLSKNSGLFSNGYDLYNLDTRYLEFVSWTYSPLIIKKLVNNAWIMVAKITPTPLFEDVFGHCLTVGHSGDMFVIADRRIMKIESRELRCLADYTRNASGGKLK